MKTFKRILAIIVSILITASTFSMSAFAAEGDTTTTTTTTLSSDVTEEPTPEPEKMTVTVTTDKEKAAEEALANDPNSVVDTSYDVGDTVIVYVKVTNNYNATALRLPVMFDSEVYELPALPNVKALNSASDNGTIGYNAENDGSFIPENYDASQFGCILLQWTAKVTNGVVGVINAPDGEYCFSFELTVKKAAGGKTGTIFIPSESDLFYDQAIEVASDATTIYYIKDAIENLYNFIDVDVIINAINMVLVPNDTYGTPAVIDEDNLFVWGFTTGLIGNAQIKQFVSSTGGAVIRSTATELGFGTGTKINLYDGTDILKTYTLILFGDVNGDALIDINDVLSISKPASGLSNYEENSLVFAADVNFDGSLDVNDVLKVSKVNLGSDTIDQSPELS
ncbi:MAG: dockerin type I domain-containing protein [Clostridia bacterium]|nr:dockerin type I domain-containing protein [Clostridia bacterium]